MARNPDKLVRAFRKRAGRLKRPLAVRYGKEAATEISQQAIEVYEVLAPEIATIGGGLLNASLAATYEYLAYAKVLSRRGASKEEIGAVFDESYAELISRVPRFLGPLIFRLARPFLRWRLRKEALESRQSPTEGGWAFDFVERSQRGSKEDGVDFGFNVTSCAVCSTFHRHGEGEVVPYLCALDDRMSETMGMGLRRTGTKALGSECCDFRYNAGGSPRTLRAQYSLPVIDS